MVVKARSHLFDQGWRRVRRLQKPVVSVGNLTVGGTGKTPVVMALAEEFLRLGMKPVILSRGYGRRSSGPVVVSRGAGPVVPWEQSGDEPFLLAQRLLGVSVIVSGSRFEAGRIAEEQELGDVFVLDDGFQHRQLHRDFDLVTIRAAEWQAGESLLPSGRWREPKDALRRAHAACVQTEGHPVPEDIAIRAFPVVHRTEGLFGPHGEIDPKTLASQEVIAFAGIANPERFFESLRSVGVRARETRQFADHHAYSASDLASLGPGIRVTTEKDAVRLGVTDCLVLRIRAIISDADELMRMILDRFRMAGWH